MFAGHVGAALIIGRADRRVNVGGFIFSALLLDAVLWVLVLLGWESVSIPADFTSTHQPAFVFPYSHGLLFSLGWCVLAGAAVFLWHVHLKLGRFRAAALIAVAVFSHWLLDVLVHRPELPVTLAGSIKVGFGLWQNMPVALAVEALIVVLGLGIFLPGASLSRARKSWLAVVCLLVLAFTVLGMTVAPAPPSVSAMAASSLLTIIVLCALVGWIARPYQVAPGSS